jgi:hypothetical protein
MHPVIRVPLTIHWEVILETNTPHGIANPLVGINNTLVSAESRIKVLGCSGTKIVVSHNLITVICAVHNPYHKLFAYSR